MAEDFKDAIDSIITTAASAPSAKEAAGVVIAKVAEQIGLYREDPATLELLVEKLNDAAGDITDAVANAGNG